MNRLNRFKFSILILISAMLFLASCGSNGEVRVIEDSPQNMADRSAQRADSVETFMQLRTGLLEPVDNLDPLFINNLSSKRILSLIYDGLFTVDENGNVAQALVQNTTVSDDSLTYTFEINTDLFYHDSDVFISGVGRRVQAADIKWAFDRTAQATVPDHASKLLMNVEGYQDYFEDQRYIYDSGRRSLAGVSGIQVVNSQTIRFSLIEPDPKFTNKLASPFLSVYPREALRLQNRSLKTNPVGTGAFRFEERNGNTIILVREDSGADQEHLTSPRLNRIDFTYYAQESTLFQQFASNNIDWIPEVGPETQRVVFGENGSLSPGYRNQYNAHRIGERRVQFYLNETRRTNISWLRNRLANVSTDSIAFTGMSTVINPITAPETVSGSPDSQYYVTYTTDPYARGLLIQIQQNYLAPDSEFTLSDIRTPISRTSIYTLSNDTFHESFMPFESGAWMRLSTPGYGLSRTGVSGISDSKTAWKLFVEDIRVTEDQTDTQ